MVQSAPDDIPSLPVEELARFLLACAREDPTLLARSNPGHRALPDLKSRLPPTPPAEPRPLRLRDRDARPEAALEELVSIAVACARRAEDALQRTREAGVAARQRMSMVAVVFGGCTLSAIAAIAVDHHDAIAESRLAQAVSAILSFDRYNSERQTVAGASDAPAVRETIASNGPSKPVAGSEVARPDSAGLTQVSAPPPGAPAETLAAAVPVQQAIAPGTDQTGTASGPTQVASLPDGAAINPTPSEVRAPPPMPAALTSPDPASGQRVSVPSQTDALASAAPARQASRVAARPATASRASYQATRAYRPRTQYGINPPYVLNQIVFNVRRTISQIFR
jgi:hypothetical protein